MKPVDDTDLLEYSRPSLFISSASYYGKLCCDSLLEIYNFMNTVIPEMIFHTIKAVSDRSVLSAQERQIAGGYGGGHADIEEREG